MIIKGKAKTAVRRLAASSVVQTFTADPYRRVEDFAPGRGSAALGARTE